MKLLLLSLTIILSACAPKTYTKPEVGMNRLEFDRLCPLNTDFPFRDEERSVTTAEGTAITLVYPAKETRPNSCVATFTFTNDKLTSIAR